VYIDRYGDPDGTAAAVRANLFDLLPTTQKAVALPLPSYSLKVVERHVGFKRSQKEYGGEWSMARYIEATETEDEKLRQTVMADILKYNEEDLAATWAVLCWLQGFGRKMEIAVTTSH
jgi:predicted RecB family nuclease